MLKARLFILLLVCIAVSGCSRWFSSRSIVHDYELYENGKPKSEATGYYFEGWVSNSKISHSHSTGYFENGHLKFEEWLIDEKPLFKLAFHENGQLKSEERFFNGDLVYGIDYTQEGQIERTVGQLMNWISKKNIR